MKKMILLLTALCLLLVGCGKEDVKTGATKDAADNTAGQNTSAPAEESVSAAVVNPLPDTTMDNLPMLFWPSLWKRGVPMLMTPASCRWM